MSSARLSRAAFFGGLIVLAFANGISERVYVSIADNGPGGAAVETFGISLIIWAACVVSVKTLLGGAPEPVRRRDLAFGSLVCAMALLPVPALGSVALVCIAAYLWLAAGTDAARRTALVVFAMTLPLFWDKLLLVVFSDTILHLDALLVAAVVGTTATSNVVPLPDGSGALFLAPACSSVANLSLSVVVSAIFVSLPGRAWSRRDLWWSAACAVSVICVNTARISLLGFYPDHFELIHGPVGSNIANALMLVALLTIAHNRIGLNASRDR